MKKLCKGFTLIELLVVLLIIGIVLGVAMLAPGSGNTKKKIDDEVQQLAYLLNVASEKALLSDVEKGFSVEDHQYNWWSWNKEQEVWEPFSNDVFTQHKLSEDIALAFEPPSQNNERGPDVVFYSDGSITPANIILTSKDSLKDQRVVEINGAKAFVR